MNIKNNFILIRDSAQEYKVPIIISFITTWVFGLFTHLFILTNKLPNWDSWVPYNNARWIATQGRWFFEFVNKISGPYTSPAIEGFFFLLYVSIMICITIYILQIKKPWEIICLSMVNITMPTFACYFAYLGGTDVFAFAYLLVTIAALITDEFKHGYMWSAILLALALGIYQTTFMYYIALSVLIGILCVIKENNINKILAKALSFLVSIIMGGVLYFIILKLFLLITGMALSSYKNINAIGSPAFFLQILINMPTFILDAYKNYISYFFRYGTFDLFFWAHCALILIAIWLLTQIILIKKIYQSALRLSILLLLVIFWPLFVRLVFIVSMGTENQMLSMLTMVLNYYFIIKIFDIYLDCVMTENRVGLCSYHSFLKICLILIMLVVIRNNFLASNAGYYKMYMGYEKLTSFSNRLISKIENYPGFDIDTDSVVLLGIPKELTNTNDFSELHFLTGMGGASDLFNCYSFQYYLRYYLGSDIKIIQTYGTNIQQDLLNREKIKNLPDYPRQGSMIIEKNILIVKF